MTIETLLRVCQSFNLIFNFAWLFVALVVKNRPASTGGIRDAGSIPGWGRSSGEGNGNPLQYSCLENPMDRGTWRATVLTGKELNTTTEAK